MKMMETTAAWAAPRQSFDYRAMAATAEAERQTLKSLLDRAKAQRPRTAEQELLRRREVRLLTDMYYEQRSNARLFAAKAAQREQ